MPPLTLSNEVRDDTENELLYLFPDDQGAVGEERGGAGDARAKETARVGPRRRPVHGEEEKQEQEEGLQLSKKKGNSKT